MLSEGCDGGVSNHGDLERGREAYAVRAWQDAYDSLKKADQALTLAPADLELLATAAYMLGLEDVYLSTLQRVHQAHLNGGEPLLAARAALWVGMTFAQKGETGAAGGWLARASRLIDRVGGECAEQGYMLLPLMFRQEAAGDLEAAIATAAAAMEVGERLSDPDLFALAVHSRGHLLAIDGSPAEGLKFLDEAMVAVTTGELSPIVSGIVYCGVILGCQAAHEPRRAKEWTTALSEWCALQPDMVAFTGRCLVHRAEVLRLRGSWEEALEETRRAGRRCLEGNNRRAAGEAAYLEAELHRLQGRFSAAVAAYREANERGREPQPGQALLRLAQGDCDAALGGIRRAAQEAAEEQQRAAILPALVEVLLAAGELNEAEAACAELGAIAATYSGGTLDAVFAHSSAAMALAADDTTEALIAARRAAETWDDLEAPYEAARARELIAEACRAAGDADAAEMEMQTALDTFARLGARPDLERAGGWIREAAKPDLHGLTARELEVLRLAATGNTNKAIAAELVLSERTVERHMSNIFTKLGVSSRAAATAFAYEHQLLSGPR